MSCRPRGKRAPTVVMSVVLLILHSFTGSLRAQDQSYPEFRFDGQLRLRGEADGRTVDLSPDFATLSRIRGGVRVGVLDWVRVYVQLQDARAWGTETNTVADAAADNFDMHQGYAELGRSTRFTARLGRQEMAIADERIVGTVGWSNTGRSLDGVRMYGNTGEFSWNAFVYNVVERDSLLSVGLNPQLNQGEYDDGWLIGAFASTTIGPALSELTFVHDRDAITDESYTANFRLHGRTGVVLFEAAGAYQFGPERSAYLASGSAGVAVGKVSLAAQLDYLSGNKDPNDPKEKAFNTLYATNHKFYGIMDYFLDIPLQLDRAGLVDAVLRGSLTPSETTVLRLDLHRFRTAHKRSAETDLGTELDLVGRWSFAQAGNLEAGIGVFAPERLATDFFPAFANGTSTTWWGYVQFLISWS